MEREIYKELDAWRTGDYRKVLLLRGARQVGKTYIIRELGKEFKYFLEVNFELEPEVKSFFEGNLHPADICTKLSAYYGVPVIEGETLLFFDEVQA
ncbi:MAG: AAA family ATPase, partial [Bacteroidales bacterium]|nr:AAA family ATPase [Bacteroidales bacterium]